MSATDEDAEVWVPPNTDCMEWRYDEPCPHCGAPQFHHRTGRCGSCGRRRPAPGRPRQQVAR